MSGTVRRMEIDGLRERRDAEALELEVRRLAERYGLTVGNVDVTTARHRRPAAPASASARRGRERRKRGPAAE